MSGQVFRLARPGSVEEILNLIESEKPKKLMVLMWDENDECSTSWTPMSLMEINWALRVLNVGLDEHVTRVRTDWIRDSE